ncbi:hypothetical protein RYZ26_00325 [Terasakiella sp. A23]|uniref:hypothetical protein n=1 Tax=Terasakiella sp. FCG-A23 TaxID=3080561 RepID=UPI002953003F|nr:hypothetical protein [Terasakiella sp. A23]MDV7338018.1 hypothetical protein [Terasakiella sp. A23]
MIPVVTTHSLLKSLLNDLVTTHGEPDYARFRILGPIEQKYRAFFEVLRNSEDDLSIVLALIEKDPDCLAYNPIVRLQALVDYVQIAFFMYSQVDKLSKKSTVH